MTAWRNAAALNAIRDEADEKWPKRSHASDGTIGDATHQSETSDHNPDHNGIVHAIDLTNDPAHGFDAWVIAQQIAGRMASGLEHRVEYLVSNNGEHDVIFHPSVSPNWRLNYAEGGQNHRSHLHVSIKHTLAAETDTTPFFMAGPTPTRPEHPEDFMAALSEEEQRELYNNAKTLVAWKNEQDKAGTWQKVSDIHRKLSVIASAFTRDGSDPDDATLRANIKKLRDRVSAIWRQVVPAAATEPPAPQ